MLVRANIHVAVRWRNQRSMWTEPPAALTRISAVHHCTLFNMFHQLNTKPDKKLCSKALLLESVMCSLKLHRTTGKKSAARHSTHILYEHVEQYVFFGHIWKSEVDFWEDSFYPREQSFSGLDILVVKVTEVQEPFFSWTAGSLGCSRVFFSGKTTVSEALHRSLMCGRMARWQLWVCRKAPQGS